VAEKLMPNAKNAIFDLFYDEEKREESEQNKAGQNKVPSTCG
jgi:hypothetical protein